MNTIAVELLKRDEGYRRFVYKDSVGKLTIGYGLNLEDEGLSEEEAEFLLRRKVIERDRILREKKGLPYVMLSAFRQAVLLDMAYQLGIGGLMKFVKMWSAIETGQYQNAAREMLDSAWARHTPDRAERLAEIMRTDRLQ